MLFLIGSVVGVFASQDLLLFYVFFEAMLIPLYVLIGVWGGPDRQRATLTFVLYTMAGSLLMLAAVVAYGISVGTFSLVPSEGTSAEQWIFLGFVAAFAVKAPLLPLHGWLRGAYTQAPPEVAALLSGVVSKAAVAGFIWIIVFHFPEPSGRLPRADAGTRRGDARLRLAARLPAAGPARRDRLLVDGADGPDHARHLHERRISG